MSEPRFKPVTDGSSWYVADTMSTTKHNHSHPYRDKEHAQDHCDFLNQLHEKRQGSR